MKRHLLGGAFLTGLAATASGALVINELDYDPNGADTNLEWIELYNTSASPLDASAYSLELLDGATGTGTVYTTVTLPGAANSGTTIIPGNGFYVIGAGTFTPKNQAFAGASDQMQNGGSDSYRLKDATGTVIDAFLSEDGDTIAYTGPANSFEVSPFHGVDGSTTPAGGQVNGRGGSLGRYPDGADTNNNNADFHVMPRTPQAANEGTLSLPFSDTFDTVGLYPGTVGSAIFGHFVTDGVVALPAGTVPASPDPASPGSCLRLRDASGGGDELFLGGGGNIGNINVTGYWYIKATISGGMTHENSGIILKNTKTPGFLGATRNGNSAFGYESGVSIVYSAGTVLLQGVPATTGAIKVDAHVSANPDTDTNLANVATAGDRWVPFRAFVDYVGNRLYVSADNTVIYDNTVPSGIGNVGGVQLGYRQAGGTFGAENGGFFDAIVINTDVSVAAQAGDWMILSEQ